MAGALAVNGHRPRWADWRFCPPKGLADCFDLDRVLCAGLREGEAFDIARKTANSLGGLAWEGIA
jgi:hypothetical protein